MKIFKHKILQSVFLMITTTFFSLSVSAGSCNDKSCTATINYIYPYGPSGEVRIKLNDVNVSKLDCAAHEGGLTLIKNDSQLLFSEIYSLLLMAATKDDEILLRIKKKSPKCEVIYAIYRP